MSIGKPKPKAPAAPDIQEMIQASARANRVNTATPYGSQTYTENPDGTWSSQVQFSPEMRALFDKQLGLANESPERYQSRAMGDALRARMEQKLGRS